MSVCKRKRGRERAGTHMSLHACIYRSENVLVSFLLISISWDHLGRGNLNWENVPLWVYDWPVGKPVGVLFQLMIDVGGRAHLTIGCTTPGQMVLYYMRYQAEKFMRINRQNPNMHASNIPRWPLVQSLPLGTCLEFLPWLLTLVIDCDKDI